MCCEKAQEWALKFENADKFCYHPYYNVKLRLWLTFLIRPGGCFPLFVALRYKSILQQKKR